ncbi:hypothetical protein Q8A73_008275 [Channa argus]|nr:hypothetical protein Q8A73_008275 [Channa argus]
MRTTKPSDGEIPPHELSYKLWSAPAVGVLGGREDGRKQRSMKGLGRAKGGSGVVDAVGWWVRIMVVKPLFPPGEKKGVNDTLELPTPTRRSSLLFMEGEKGGVNEGLGEGAYGRVRGEGRGKRGSREGCLAAAVSAEEMVETDLKTKLRQDSSKRVFSTTNEGQSVTNMSPRFEL